MDKAQTILIVDPDADFLEWMQHQLETPTTRVLTASNADDAFRIYSSEQPDLLITETHLQPFSGLELLVKARQRDPNSMVILISAWGTTQNVIESMKLGAFDFHRLDDVLRGAPGADQNDHRVRIALACLYEQFEAAERLQVCLRNQQIGLLARVDTECIVSIGRGEHARRRRLELMLHPLEKIGIGIDDENGLGFIHRGAGQNATQ